MNSSSEESPSNLDINPAFQIMDPADRAMRVNDKKRE
jgi:hypothetical protein